MRKFALLKRVLPQFIITASLIVALVPPIPVQAADMAWQDSLQFKLLEYCEDNSDYEHAEACVAAHYGGYANKDKIEFECRMQEPLNPEPERCVHEALMGLNINKKFRPKPDENDKCDVAVPLRPPPECIGNVPGNYPNTKCYSYVGREILRKLCPRNAAYPNGKPPSPDKCYLSTITENTGGRDLYDEMPDCDESKFSVLIDGEKPPGSEEENGQACTERFPFSAGWIVCSVLELVSDGITSLFDIADSLLNVDGQNLYENEELRAIWSYFRVVATFALVIIGLVMVISQAIGSGL